MDPTLLAQLMSYLNPMGTAMAAPGRASEFVVPGPDLSLAAQAVPPATRGLVPTGLVQPGVPADFVPPHTMRPVEAYQTTPMPTVPTDVSASPKTLGATLEPGVPLPRPRPTEIGGSVANAAANAPGSTGSKILDTLKSVKAPEAPVPQKVSTPNAPQIRPIQGGGFFDLLATLGIGPQQAMQGLKLPSTLGQALGEVRR